MDIDLIQELFIPMVVEGYFYGLYSAIFAMYIQCQVSKQNINKSNKILPYSLYVLYILSTVTFAVDMVTFIIDTKAISTSYNQQAYASYLVDMLHLYWVSTVTTGLCDFISGNTNLSMFYCMERQCLDHNNSFHLDIHIPKYLVGDYWHKHHLCLCVDN